MAGHVKIQFARDVPFRVPVPSGPVISRRLVGWAFIKDLLMLIQPAAVWNRIAIEPRSLAFVFWNNFLPMLVLSGMAEGFGVLYSSKSRMVSMTGDPVSVSEIFYFELVQAGALLLLTLACAGIITLLVNTCHRRNHYAESLLLMLHALGPFLLLQLFNAIPGINLWLTWVAGMTAVCLALYVGLPRILQPDAPSALGLFFSSVLVVVMLFFCARLLACWYLIRQFRSIQDAFSLFTANF